jgi:hypothetical protein
MGLRSVEGKYHAQFHPINFQWSVIVNTLGLLKCHLRKNSKILCWQRLVDIRGEAWLNSFLGILKWKIICSEKTAKKCGFINGIFKLLRCQGIDPKESISPAYVAWRAGTTTLFLLGS